MWAYCRHLGTALLDQSTDVLVRADSTWAASQRPDAAQELRSDNATELDHTMILRCIQRDHTRARRRAQMRRAAVALLSLLPACAVGPNYVRPEPPLPTEWQTTEGVAAKSADLGRWWESLGDAQLSRLVNAALASNLDLAEAAGRVEEARALYRATSSAKLPAVDANADVRYQRQSENGLAGTGESDPLYQVGLSASWEVDLFGRVRRSVEAAGARIEATEEDRRDVLVAVIADVASAYIDTRTLQRRLAVAHANLASQGQTVDLTRIRLEGGIATALDVAQAESVHANTRTVIPPLEAALAVQFNRLSVLLGETPGGVATTLEQSAPVPAVPPELTVALPVDLVRQRPDIRRAERELAAQTAQIGVATADLYPRLTLLGTFGFDALTVADLFAGGSRAYSVGPAVQWNVFDAGRIRALIGAEQARAAQALARYERAILIGLGEVENALVVFARLRDEQVATLDAVRAATLSLELATLLYKDGIADFQNVLDAQRTVLQFEDQLARTDGAVTQSVVQLYRALGGGWAAVAPPEGAERVADGPLEGGAPRRRPLADVRSTPEERPSLESACPHAVPYAGNRKSDGLWAGRLQSGTAQHRSAWIA
jgi:NodT family efflux transporter outer membrane factor (OMF) lipoprotein